MQGWFNIHCFSLIQSNVVSSVFTDALLVDALEDDDADGALAVETTAFFFLLDDRRERSAEEPPVDAAAVSDTLVVVVVTSSVSLESAEALDPLLAPPLTLPPLLLLSLVGEAAWEAEGEAAALLLPL